MAHELVGDAVSLQALEENERAIRSYARVGFRPVGIMRRAERAPDGRWRDALVMDLLAEELT
jgi:aminoglycoside 6'-N-acetyltransferase